VESVTYNLSNDTNNGHAVFHFADFFDEGNAMDTCKTCSINISSPFNDGERLDCNDIGAYEVKVSVRNDEGMETSATVEIHVVDPHPPVVTPKKYVMEVLLGKDESAIISMKDFVFYDNCKISDKYLSRDTDAYGSVCAGNGKTCKLSCADTYGGSPFSVTFTVTDSSGLQSSATAQFKVIDASDRDEDGLPDCAESLIFFTDPDIADRVYAVDGRLPDGETLSPIFPWHPVESKCARADVLGTVIELRSDNDDGGKNERSGIARRKCPYGKLKVLSADVTWPWITPADEVDSGYLIDSGEKTAIERFNGRQRIELPEGLFSVDTHNQLIAEALSKTREHLRLLLTSERSAIYARQTSQPVVQINLSCTAYPSKPMTGVLFLRLSADHQCGSGTPLEEQCRGGITVGGYDGYVEDDPRCPEESSHSLDSSKDWSGRSLRGGDDYKQRPKVDDLSSSFQSIYSDALSEKGPADGKDSFNKILVGLKAKLNEDSRSEKTKMNELREKMEKAKEKKKKNAGRSEGCVLDEAGKVCDPAFVVDNRFCTTGCKPEMEMFGRGISDGLQYPICCNNQE
jgi:hypothetical protein